MADSNTLMPTGKSKRRVDLGSSQEADAVVDVSKRAGEDVTNDIQRTGHYLATLQASYTRPGDTTAYTAGDVLANSTSAATILTFASAVRANAGGGRIVGARVVSDAAAGTKGDPELYLFRSSITMQQDNAAWGPTDAEMRNCIGVIAFGSAPKVGSGNEIWAATGLDIAFKAGAGLTDIYGVVVVRNGYTPANAGVLQFELDVEQD